jgi:hypothetical protein
MMTAKELIDQLATFPPEIPVLIALGDERASPLYSLGQTDSAQETSETEVFIGAEKKEDDEDDEDFGPPFTAILLWSALNAF